MNKPKIKEVILLSLPAVFMIGFAIFLQNPRGNGNLTFVRSQVRSLPNPPFHTQVDVVVKYASPSPLPEFITRPDYGCKGWKVVDAQGKSVNFNSSGAGIGPVGNYLYGFMFQFPMSEIPKSAGKLTLKAVVRVNDKTLPLSVVVRKS